MKSIKKILVPTDFSPHATEAFRVAHELAKAIGANIVMVHISRAPTVISDGGQPLPAPSGWDQDAWDRLRAIRPTDPAVGVEHEVIVAERPSVSHVLRILEASGCDLIVMGTHGLNNLKHRLLGGLTEEVVRLARCPVMVVKGPAEEATPDHADILAQEVSQGPEVTAQQEDAAPDPMQCEVTGPHAVAATPDSALHGEYLG